MRLNQGFDDAQPQSRPLSLRFGLHVFVVLKESGNLDLRNPWSRVGYRRNGHALPNLGTKSDTSRGRGKFQRVVDQIREHTLKRNRIALYRRQPLLQREIETLVA